MSIASNRSRRPNAGAKMNEISGKEDDEFYKQAYGGFVEEDNDNEFEPEGSDDEAADESIRKNGESADKDDKEYPVAKRLKTEAKAATEEVDSDEEDEDEDEDDYEEEDDDDEGEDEDDEEENGEDEDEDAEGEGEGEDAEAEGEDAEAEEEEEEEDDTVQVKS